MTEIENNIEAPVEKKTRARKPTKKKENPANELLEALKFISVCQKKVGEILHQYCIINNNWAVASNGILTIATQVKETMSVCPHTLQFIEALNKCQNELSIVQLKQDTLAVSSGYFSGLVPCVDLSALNINGPDASCASISDSLKPALMVAASLTIENGADEFLSAVLLQSGSCVGTDRFSMVEAWHGHDLPPNMILPRQAALAVAKSTKKLTGFGYSGSSATFWFEDDSFIKTQLFNSNYPNYKRILDVSHEAQKLPKEFFRALRAIEPFSETGNVYFKDSSICSDSEVEISSTYKLKGLPEGMGFAAKRLLQFENYADTAYFNEHAKCVFFYTESTRACVMGLSAPVKETQNESADDNDDISF